MRRAIFLLIQRSVRRAFFKAHPATAARDDEKCTHDRMRRVYNDELVPAANSISLPLRVSRCTRRAAVSSEKTRVHAVFLLSSSVSLLPNHAISFHDQNLRIIHCARVRVCTYICAIRRHEARILFVVVTTTNPRAPPPASLRERQQSLTLACVYRH